MLGLDFDQWFKVAGGLGAICTFLYTYYTWRDKSKNEFEATRAQGQHEADTRRIEATKPFLDLQLQHYIEITKIVSCLATSEDDREMESALKAFWQLYYGELALVEGPKVEAAMVKIGEELRRITAKVIGPANGALAGDQQGSGSPAGAPPAADVVDRRNLQLLALNLTAAIRGSLDDSWGVEAWSGAEHFARKSATPRL